MNILCHSSVIEIDSDDSGSIVFADSQSGEKGTSISVPENPDKCRKILKKVVTDFGTDNNKKTISITAFFGSCSNSFYRHFRKPWIEKRTAFVDTKSSFLKYLVKFTGKHLCWSLFLIKFY